MVDLCDFPKKMNMIPVLSITEIKQFFGNDVFNKANHYVDYDIFKTFRTNDTLFSSCRGSSGIYKQQCRFLEGVISELKCTCPAMRHFGPCKHIAAMLLKWVENKGYFAPRADIKIILKSKTKEDLIKIITTLCDKNEKYAESLHKLLEKKQIKKKKFKNMMSSEDE